MSIKYLTIEELDAMETVSTKKTSERRGIGEQVRSTIAGVELNQWFELTKELGLTDPSVAVRDPKTNLPVGDERKTVPYNSTQEHAQMALTKYRGYVAHVSKTFFDRAVQYETLIKKMGETYHIFMKVTAK